MKMSYLSLISGNLLTYYPAHPLTLNSEGITSIIGSPLEITSLKAAMRK